MEANALLIDVASRIFPWAHQRLMRRRQIKKGGLVATYEFLMRPPYNVAIPRHLTQADSRAFQAIPQTYLHLIENLCGVVVDRLLVRLDLFNPGPLPVSIGNIWADIHDRWAPQFPTTVRVSSGGASEIDIVVLNLDEEEPSGIVARWENGRIEPTHQTWWASRALAIAPNETVPILLVCQTTKDHLRFQVIVNYTVNGHRHFASVPGHPGSWQVTAKPPAARILGYTNLLMHEGRPGVLLDSTGLIPIE